MHKPDKNERDIIQTIADRCKSAKCLAKKNLKIDYHTADDNRVVIAEIAAGNLRKFGVAAYNTNDRKLGLPMNEDIGRRIALARALRS